MNRRGWVLIATYAGIVILVLASSVLFFYWRPGGGTKGTTGVPSATTTPQQTTPQSTQKPVIKSAGPITIDYRLYGRIGSIDNEDNQGLHVGFIFDGDTLKTRIPVVVRYHEQGYKLFTYEQNFGPTYSLRSVDGPSFRQLVVVGKPLVELRVQFSKSNLSQDNVNAMRALEAVSQGSWGALPRSELVADSVGIVK